VGGIGSGRTARSLESKDAASLLDFFSVLLNPDPNSQIGRPWQNYLKATRPWGLGLRVWIRAVSLIVVLLVVVWRVIEWVWSALAK
jgi:hypothetical protein